MNIQSPHPAVSPDPAEARARTAGHRCFATLEAWPALPWLVEELVGTQWINLHTCEVVTIEAVTKAKPGIDEGYNRIGFVYENRRLIVEHWVRWDVLPPEAQLAWYCAKLRYLQKDIAYQRTKLAQRDMDGGERTYRKWDLKRTEERLATTTVEVSEFARDHSLPFDIASLANEVTLTQSQPAQLALFGGEGL
jgi:hypothetical protein